MPDMTAAYKDELRILKKSEKFILADLAKRTRQTKKEIARLNKSLDRASKGTMKTLNKITRRQNILEGRLS